MSILLLSPEQLASPGFEGLLQHGVFKQRLCAMGVDEIHLLYSWGQLFRQAFRQLGFVRARMSSWVRLVGTTATLLSGHPQDTVLRFMGLRQGEFHLIRRSNLRRNVRTIFRVLTCGVGGWSFPDLKWIVHSGRKTVIHCSTIALGFRLALYLWHLCPPSPDRRIRIRLYNALNWPSYNTETRDLMRNDPNAQIIIATATFMVGIDLPNIADVVILGNLVSADEHIQWEGRAGRDPRVVTDARCITYVTSQALLAARALSAGESVRGTKSTGGKPAPVQMEVSMARLLCAACVSAEQDILYDNPSTDPLCFCPPCLAMASQAPPSTSLSSCNCSAPGCMPEEPAPVAAKKRRAADTNPVPRRQRISPAMRKEGTKQLLELRMTIYFSPGTRHTQSLPPEIFLPDVVIKHLLDRFALIDSKDTLRDMIVTRTHLLRHIDTLWAKMQGLAVLFEEIRDKEREEKRKKRAQKSQSSSKGARAGKEQSGGKGSSAAPIVSAACASDGHDGQSARYVALFWISYSVQLTRRSSDPAHMPPTPGSPVHSRSGSMSLMSFLAIAVQPVGVMMLSLGCRALEARC